MRFVHFHLAVGCHLRLGGIEMTVHDVIKDSVELKRRDTGQSMTFTWEELALKAMHQEVLFLDGLAAQPITKDTFPVAWERMDDSKFARIDRRIAYVSALKNLNIRSPDNPVFRMAVKAVSLRRNENPGPSPHSVYRWLRNYRKSGYDTDGLAQEFACKRERSGRKPPGVQKAITEKLMAKLANAGDTVRGSYNDIMKEVAEDLGYSGYRNLDGDEVYLRPKQTGKKGKE